MKVVLVNGSRRDAGCTYTALSVVAKELEAQGIDTEIVAVGSRVVKGELDAVVKEVGAKITDADGLIVGSPVYLCFSNRRDINVPRQIIWCIW